MPSTPDPTPTVDALDHGAATAPTERELREGFRAFVSASKRLERSYAALKRRAESIDVELTTTNRALEQALGEKDAILSSLPVGVLATRTDGQLVWSNPEGQRLRAALDEAGLAIGDLSDGEIDRGELSVTVRRAALPDGGTLFVVEDRSDVVRLAREVDRLDRLAGLSELALGIAHEIKNPLNGVMGFATLMERTGDPAALQRYADKIRRGLTQVDDIVREMLAFARSPEQSTAQQPLSVVVREAAAAAGVPRTCIALGGDDPDVEGAALARVLANLFRNSAEAAGSAVAIDVVVSSCDGRIVLEVSDNGPGIDAETGERVFQPFVTSKDRGHGLGLALASRVMAYLGGSLELVDPGQPDRERSGAVFRVILQSADQRRSP